MSLFIDEKYANLLSPKLNLFKWIDNHTANFRCPICGDSKKNKLKKRGYFYPHPVSTEDKLMFRCHNCQASMPFHGFLKVQDPSLYDAYIFDTFKFNNEFRWYEKKAEERAQKAEKDIDLQEFKNDPVNKLTKLKDLKSDHPAYVYAKKRKIPLRYFSMLYYTDNYAQWIKDEINNTKFKKIPKTDPRIVIPFLTKDKKIYAYQGRTLLDDENIIRYVTIRKASKGLLVYGLERVDKTKDVKVLEGPFDSLFVDNAIAVAGSSLLKMLTVKNGKFIFVFDNQPRNKELLGIMQKAIDSGVRIVIWPEDVTEKDVNEMIEEGYTRSDVNAIIDENVFQGAIAQLKFNNWKKI